jgi:hypothetical protein
MVRRGLVGVALAAIVLASGCGGPAQIASAPRPSPQHTPVPSSPTPVQHGQTSGQQADVNGEPASTSSGSKANVASPAPRSGAGLPPVNLPYDTPIPVDASVEPTCVPAGGMATLTVRTKPEAAVGYQAIYSDAKGGGPAPYGAGYGGNDKGFAQEDGVYSSTWVVSPKAPAGTGRVDVIIGWKGKFGYDDPAFRVADASGGCA